MRSVVAHFSVKYVKIIAHFQYRPLCLSVQQSIIVVPNSAFCLKIGAIILSGYFI